MDTIIHLAGSRIDKRWTKRYKKKILESRIKSLELFDSLEEAVEGTEFAEHSDESTNSESDQEDN